MESGSCLNCGNNYNGNFCPQCGQKRHTHRYTLATIIHDIPHSVFHVDRGIFYTFKELTYRPGKAIREFITGKRVTHFSPFAYLMILCAIRTFIDHQTSTFDLQKTIIDQEFIVANLEVTIFFAKYPALMLCAIVPFLSFWSWIFNLRSEYNYWENFVLNIYLMAQFNVFFIIYQLVMVSNGFRNGSMTPMLVAFILYVSFAYYQFFPRRPGAMFILSRFLLGFAVAITFLSGLTFTGVMTRWWWW
jgi:hypothetical protein